MNSSLKMRAFEPSDDRLPAIEWAKWWDETLVRWHAEGLPSFEHEDDLQANFGLTRSLRCRFRCLGAGYPKLSFGEGAIEDMAGYRAMRPHLFPVDMLAASTPALERLKQQANKAVTWFGFDGFFWLPRVLFGIENHLYAFYDHPDVIHEINAELVRYNLALLKGAAQRVLPDFIVISEDMSYNGGPMISRALYDEFIHPYYRSFVPAAHALGLPVLVDTDGDVTEITGWLLDSGVDGILPIERRAGSDPVKLRQLYPKLLMIGGFDKTMMHLGEQAMLAEFEHLAPVIRGGGYLPSCDHQTPPDVSLANYETYVRLLLQYTQQR